MKTKAIVAAVAGAVILAGTTSVANAGVSYKDGDRYLKLGGRIQFQYHDDSTADSIFFRRLRPYIEGSTHADWKGKFQWDMGKSGLALKDTYFQYTGMDNMKVTIGNANFPFSREFLTSSKKQHLVERTFVGDHNYGTPDRNAGLHLTGNSGDTITWGASFASSAVDPDNRKLDFDTPVNNAAGDWSEGWMMGGRVDFHPFGKLKMSQGDFRREQKATVGVAAFSWSNDGDNLDAVRQNDVDKVTGVEVSGAYRNAGLSVDAQYNSFSSELVDAGITDGLYQNSSTTLTSMAVEGGYMVMPNKLEVVAGYQSQDADGYADAWARTSYGVNYFFAGHDIKVQATMRQNTNKDGVTGNDFDELFVQTQYVF